MLVPRLNRTALSEPFNKLQLRKMPKNFDYKLPEFTSHANQTSEQVDRTNKFK